MQQVMNYTLTVVAQSFAFRNVKSSEIQFLFISIYLDAMPVIAWSKSVVLHLPLAVIVFCLTIVACDVDVSFLNACYVGFGPVFFCTYDECNALINLSGFPQGHPRFDILATPCGMHVAHGHSTHAEGPARSIHSAEILPWRRRGAHSGIHSAAIMPSHSSIIRRTHPSSLSCSQYYARTGKGRCARVRARSHMRALSRVRTVARPSF